MPLVNACDLLQHAFKNQYAVAGIGINDFEIAQAAIKAACTSRAPVIFNLVSHHQQFVQLDALVPSLLVMAKNADIPVAIHYDHATNEQEIRQAITLGCNSVMFEPQSENLLESMQQVSELQQLCATLGVALEAVAGHVSEDNEFKPELSPELLTQPATAKYLATKVKPDAIAVSVGNQHGRVTKAPKIDFNRLRRIHQETECPLVIHGGSGLTEEQCVRVTRKGVAKINFFSDLAHTVVSQRRKSKDYFEAIEQTQSALAEQLNAIFRLVGSAGRAAEILLQTQVWQTRSVLIGAQAPNWSEQTLAQIKMKLDALKAAVPGIVNLQQFIEVTGDDFTQRRAWVFELNQQCGLSCLEQNAEFKSLIQTLRAVASDIRVSENGAANNP